MTKKLYDSKSLFAEKVKAFLLENKLKNDKPASQAELAKLLDVSPQQVSIMLSGDVNTSLDTIDAVAQALRLHPARLIGGSDQTIDLDLLEFRRLLDKALQLDGFSWQDLLDAVSKLKKSSV